MNYTNDEYEAFLVEVERWLPAAGYNGNMGTTHTAIEKLVELARQLLRDRERLERERDEAKQTVEDLGTKLRATADEVQMLKLEVLKNPGEIWSQDKVNGYVQALQTFNRRVDDAMRLIAPFPLRMWCPRCTAQHIDEAEWTTKLHKTHQCQSCGEEWRPRDYPTVGIK